MELKSENKEVIIRELTKISMKVQLLKMGDNHKKDIRKESYENILKAVDNIVKILNKE